MISTRLLPAIRERGSRPVLLAGLNMMSRREGRDS